MGLFSNRVKAQQIKTAVELDAALVSGRPVFLDFMKHGCQPCQVMDGIINELADEFHGDAVVLKANLANVPDLFSRFKVRSTPTFVIVTKQGDGLHQRYRQSGLVKKALLADQIRRAVDSV
jgi:thioredoxin 1